MLSTALPTLSMVRIVFTRQGGEMNRHIHVFIMYVNNTDSVSNSTWRRRESFSDISIDLQDYFQVTEWDTVISLSPTAALTWNH